jgi:hypothetical protein
MENLNEIVLDGVPYDLDDMREIVLLNIVDGFPTEAALVDMDGSVYLAKVTDTDLEQLHDYNLQFNPREQRRARPVRFVRFFTEETTLRGKARHEEPLPVVDDY